MFQLFAVRFDEQTGSCDVGSLADLQAVAAPTPFDLRRETDVIQVIAIPPSFAPSLPPPLSPSLPPSMLTFVQVIVGDEAGRREGGGSVTFLSVPT